MPSQVLVDAVANQLSQGESPEDIKDFLLSEGWQEDAIDEVIARIPKPMSFWQQLPFYPRFAELDAKTAQLPPKVIFGISAFLIVLVIAIASLLYLFIDPFAMQGDVRDRDREAIHSQLLIALKRYYDKNNRYPGSLSELVPNYINYVPMDPKTNSPYDYGTTHDGGIYNLCIYFETRSPSEGCIKSGAFDVR